MEPVAAENEKLKRILMIVVLFILAGLPVWQWNEPLFHLINGANAPLADAVIGNVAGIGDGLVVAIICSLIMLYNLRMGIAGLIGFIASGLLGQILKRVFDMPRPPALFDDAHILGHALHSHSFPSGHSTSAGAMFLLMFLMLGTKDWRAWAAAFTFALAAYGRIYGGVHFPIDVWVGFGLGIACTWWAWQWVMSRPVRSWETGEWSWKVPGMILLIESAVLGLGHKIQPATAQSLTLIVPVIALVVLGNFWKRKFSANGADDG